MPYPKEEPELIDVLLLPVYLLLFAVMLVFLGVCKLYDRANRAYKAHVKRKEWRV